MVFRMSGTRKPCRGPHTVTTFRFGNVALQWFMVSFLFASVAGNALSPGAGVPNPRRSEPANHLLDSILKRVPKPLSPQTLLEIKTAVGLLEREETRCMEIFRDGLETITGLVPEFIAEDSEDHDFSDPSLDTELISRLEGRLGRFLSPEQIQGYKRLEKDCRNLRAKAADSLANTISTLSGLSPAEARKIVDETPF